MNADVIWHDIECGSYVADLPLWRELAREAAGPVLDVGAGTGRVALDLARAGHRVTALDRDPRAARGAGRAGRRRCRSRRWSPTPPASTPARRRSRSSPCRCRRSSCCPDADARAGFFASARRALAPGGLVALAIADELEGFEEPRDAAARHGRGDGWRYVSQPTAVRRGRTAARGSSACARRSRPAASARAAEDVDRARRRQRRRAASARAPLPASSRSRPATSSRPTTTSAPRWCCCVADRTLRVCALYPDLLNIYADRGNLLLLRAPLRVARHRLRAVRLRARRAARPGRARPLLHRRRPGSRPGAVRARHGRDQARRAARGRRPRRRRVRRLRRLPAARPRLRDGRRDAARASASSTSRRCARTGRG